MRMSPKLLWCLLAGALALAGTSSCRKPAEAVKSDLEQAGYSLTLADWFRATRGNDVPALKKFIAGGFAFESLDESGDSALHAATAAGAQDSADFLLDRGIPIDKPGALDRTPLMSAVLADQTAMVRWLLRQGADPRLKDQEGFSPLMLAVREGKPGSVAELTPYTRENLDAAILLAALVGQTDSIDTLTNYGASVYARMEDGRTPLMIAAENGHADAVKLLLDIGASRFSTDATGKTAADLATEAGHAEIAAIISREPTAEDLALESPEQVAKAMDAFVDAAIAPGAPEDAAKPATTSTDTQASPTNPTPPVSSRPIDGQTLSAAVAPSAIASNPGSPAAPNEPADASAIPAASPTSPDTFALPPLVMRHYREREIPLQVRSVEGETATLALPAASGSPTHEVSVRAGEALPGTRLKVVRVQRRMENSKLNLGQAMEVSVVEVEDTTTQTRREWISGVPAIGHDPVALVEDAATGQRYTATPGQRFKSADGAEYIISDVRPSQLVIEDVATGAVQTIPLRGPRG
jgi:ankyrin repeat protein